MTQLALYYRQQRRCVDGLSALHVVSGKSHARAHNTQKHETQQEQTTRHTKRHTVGVYHILPIPLPPSFCRSFSSLASRLQFRTLVLRGATAATCECAKLFADTQQQAANETNTEKSDFPFLRPV